MAGRSEDWNVALVRDLENPAFAREFLLSAVEDPTQETLNRLLKPFKLRFTLARIETRKRRAAGIN